MKRTSKPAGQASRPPLNQNTAKATPQATVVGIGASAGGLSAISELLEHLPSQNNIAYVVVQHMPSHSQSHLATILARLTPMAVCVAEEGMEIKAQTLYVCPPAQLLRIHQGRLRLEGQTKTSPSSLPIDAFFASLATEYGNNAAAIVLSGAGSDGSRGVLAVRNGGGLVLVQHQESAEFDGMPRSAIASGAASQVLEAAEMGAVLAQHFPTAPLELLEVAPAELEPIFALLKAKFNTDFALYQESTLTRRIAHRLGVVGVALEAYPAYLEQHPTELQRLYQDLLVGVTHFNRDEAAFAALEKHVIKPLVDQLQHETLRLWVAGCATGQEAYSLAIALSENLRQQNKALDFKIFATDISSASLAIASKGIYNTEALASFADDLRDRYFKPVAEGYQVIEDLRNHIIFANHNVFQDAPFTRIHLVSCRNLLIYFKPEARRRILTRFHFALNNEGYLFLGPSENLNELTHQFDELDSKWRLFQKRPGGRLLDSSQLINNIEMPQLGRRKTKETLQQVQLERQKKILSTLFSAGFLLSSDFQLLETFGDAHTLLSFPEGQAKLQIFGFLRGDLLHVVRTGLHQVARTKGSFSQRIPDHSNPSQAQLVTVRALAVNEGEEQLYLVSLQADSETVVPLTRTSTALEAESALQIEALEQALRFSEAQLQTTVEELETTNEELMASNEELMALNEELQSVNEELHSVNEELHTINVEFQDKLQAVTQANNDLINLQNIAEIGTVFVDKDMRIRSYSPLLAQKFNFLPQDIGRPIEHLIQSLQTEVTFFRQALGQTMTSSKVSEFEAHDHNGAPYWLRLMPYISSDGSNEGAVLSLTEITQLKEAHAAINERNRFSENLIAASPGINYVYVVGKGRVTFASNDFPSLLGYTDEQAKSLGPRFLVEMMHPDDVKRLADHNKRLAISKASEAVSFEYRARHADGHWVWIETRETVHKRDEHGEVREILGIALDISSRKNIESKLQFDALHDSLTGLKNRIAFIGHLEQAHKDFIRYPDHNYALMFIDLDRFKAVNDRFGHSAGDQVLVATARRIERCLREVDIVARHSGDEFLVLLSNIHSEAEAKIVAEKIIHALEVPIVFKGHSLEVSASIGIVMANPDQKLPDLLINSADIAMYKSKEKGGKSISVFDDSLHLDTVAQVNLEHDLRIALRKKQLCVYYQPIVDLKTQAVVSLEALARWPKSGGGFIAPEKFIPLAETAHLIGKIDRTVFEQAYGFLDTLKQDHLKINLNISAKQLTDPSTLEYLIESPIDPHRICLEVTESQLLLKDSRPVEVLESLSKIGYQIAIDDFGAGYSSLGYLQSLPARTLKIDRSFVQSLETNEKSRKIVDAIMNLAKSLDYKVVAEGIETQEQLRYVCELGCDLGQGYLFSRPMPPDHCTEFLNTRRSLN